MYIPLNLRITFPNSLDWMYSWAILQNSLCLLYGRTFSSGYCFEYSDLIIICGDLEPDYYSLFQAPHGDWYNQLSPVKCHLGMGGLAGTNISRYL